MAKSESLAVVYISKDGQTLWSQLGNGPDQARQIQEIESGGGQVLRVASQTEAKSLVNQALQSPDILRR